MTISKFSGVVPDKTQATAEYTKNVKSMMTYIVTFVDEMNKSIDEMNEVASQILSKEISVYDDSELKELIAALQLAEKANREEIQRDLSIAIASVNKKISGLTESIEIVSSEIKSNRDSVENFISERVSAIKKDNDAKFKAIEESMAELKSLIIGE